MSQTSLQTPDPRLPQVLRDSKLPWKPRFEDQAPAPRPDDAWTAHFGGLCLELETRSPAFMCGPNDPPLTLYLHYPNPSQSQTWNPSSIPAAVQMAEALVDVLFQQLRTTLTQKLQP